MPSASSSTDESGPSGTSRLARVVARMGALRQPPPRVRGVLLLVAVSVFAVGIVVSFRELDLRPGELNLAWLALVVVALTPLNLLVNVLELQVMARCVSRDGRLGWRSATRTTVLATAANVLPLPGGALVRIHALTGLGVSARRATGINVVGAMLWVAAGLLVAGLAALPQAPLLGAGAVVAALAGAGVSLALSRPLVAEQGLRPLLALIGVEVATTLVHGVRLFAVLQVLGVTATVRDGLVLGAAGPLAASAGVFPSGLGLAELLTALIAPVVDVPAAAGFAATGLGRILGLAVALPLALAFGARDLLQRGAAASVPPGDAQP